MAQRNLYDAVPFNRGCSHYDRNKSRRLLQVLGPPSLRLRLSKSPQPPRQCLGADPVTMSDVGDRPSSLDLLQKLLVERPPLPTRHATTLSPIMPSRKRSIAG